MRKTTTSCVNMICKIGDPKQWVDAVKMLQLILDHEEELQFDEVVDWNFCMIQAARYSGIELIKLIHDNKQISFDIRGKK